MEIHRTLSSSTETTYRQASFRLKEVKEEGKTINIDWDEFRKKHSREIF
jgi:hypothetical protein